MSLQVWLPLNGNLNNQGLTNINAINNGATVNASGKIGSCYQFGTAASDITIPKEAMTSFTTEASVCFWIKILTWNTSYATFFQAGPASTAWTAYIFGLLRNNANSTCCFTISNGSSASNASYLTPSLDLNVWYHISLIYKTGHCLIYINGQLYQDYTTSIAPNFSNITTIKLGRCANGSSYQTNCQMNDFRIYNHALSVKEVEEISKGLVLHYKLDNNGLGGKNLISNFDTSFIEYSDGTSTLFTNQMNGGTQEIISNFNGAIKCLHLHNLGGNGRQYRTWSVQAGKTYTISADYYSENAQSTAWRGELNGGDYSWLGANAAYTTPGKWQRLSYTYNDLTSDATIYFFIYCAVNQDCYIKNIKIEEGSIATSWSPYVNENIIYDSSGYQHNGDLIGTITNSALTARYNVSTHFINGSYGRIQEKPSICLPTDAITVNLWIRIDTWGNPISCTEGGGWNFENSSGIQFPVYVASVGYKVANSGVTPATLGNTWHMLTGTFDKENVKIYIDGVLKKTTATGSTNPIGYANNYLFLAAEASGNNTSPANSTFVGELSDLRIYCTALTESQIKELYDTSVTIDKNGNVYARGVQEI